MDRAEIFQSREVVKYDEPRETKNHYAGDNQQQLSSQFFSHVSGATVCETADSQLGFDHRSSGISIARDRYQATPDEGVAFQEDLPGVIVSTLILRTINNMIIIFSCDLQVLIKSNC